MGANLSRHGKTTNSDFYGCKITIKKNKPQAFSLFFLILKMHRCREFSKWKIIFSRFYRFSFSRRYAKSTYI